MNKVKVMYAYDDRFCDDLSELIAELIEYEELEKEDIIGLKIDLAYPEPVIKNEIDMDDISEWLGYKFEDRWDEDMEIFDKIENIFKNHINFAALNEELKSVILFYPQKSYTITEEDYKTYENNG